MSKNNQGILFLIAIIVIFVGLTMKFCSNQKTAVEETSKYGASIDGFPDDSLINDSLTVMDADDALLPVSTDTSLHATSSFKQTSSPASVSPNYGADAEETPDDAYSRGYDEGYEQGEEDGSHGNGHGYGYDDSNNYKSHSFRVRYEQGYDDGYNDGYESET